MCCKIVIVMLSARSDLVDAEEKSELSLSYEVVATSRESSRHYCVCVCVLWSSVFVCYGPCRLK